MTVCVMCESPAHIEDAPAFALIGRMRKDLAACLARGVMSDLKCPVELPASDNPWNPPWRA